MIFSLFLDEISCPFLLYVYIFDSCLGWVALQSKLILLGRTLVAQLTLECTNVRCACFKHSAP